MIRFISQYDENSNRIEFTLPPDSTLTEVVESFEAFLKASGYHFDGVLDFVIDEDPNDEVPF
jgi:hypothetical protein